MRLLILRRLPIPKRFYAINLFGVILSRGPLSPVVANHEYIHTLQQRELWYIPFYLWYGVEWLIRLARYRNAYRSYRNLSFEREAYANERNPHYPAHRRPFAFRHYLHSNNCDL